MSPQKVSPTKGIRTKGITTKGISTKGIGNKRYLQSTMKLFATNSILVMLLEIHQFTFKNLQKKFLNFTNSLAGIAERCTMFGTFD